MYRPFPRSGQATRSPGGFTLVELLIVISIIAGLMAMITVVAANMITTARTAATRGTILKVHQMLEERRDAFVYYQLQRGQIALAISVVKNSGNYNDRQARQLAPVVARKLLFKQALPQHHGERSLSNPNATPPIVNQVKNADSSELLYWVLTSSTAFGIPAEGSFQFNGSELGDTDNDGLLEIIDGWGQPLRFYRWPTRLVRPGGPGQAIQGAHATRARVLLGNASYDRFNEDPDDDPLRRFGQWVQAVGNESLFHTPDTWHAPLVLSAGPDGETGLYEPHDIANLGHLAAPTGADQSLYDNITNQNINIGSN